MPYVQPSDPVEVFANCVVCVVAAVGAVLFGIVLAKIANSMAMSSLEQKLFVRAHGHQSYKQS